MQQIIRFIIKNSTRILFLLLLSISLFLTIQSHSFHSSRTLSSANWVTGSVYAQINRVAEYVNLKSENERLANENAFFRSWYLNAVDSTFSGDVSYVNDKNIEVYRAKVIHNSYNRKNNFLTIDKGERDGVAPFMGVVNSLGVIGIIDNTSSGYATVMSILNTKIEINARLKKSDHFGTLKWNGKNAGIVQLVDVPRLASVRTGDTIVTGSQSMIFPENIPIGRIEKVYVDTQTNYFTIDVRLFNDMTNLGHVYILNNKDREEVLELESLTNE